MAVLVPPMEVCRRAILMVYVTLWMATMALAMAAGCTLELGGRVVSALAHSCSALLGLAAAAAAGSSPFRHGLLSRHGHRQITDCHAHRGTPTPSRWPPRRPAFKGCSQAGINKEAPSYMRAQANVGSAYLRIEMTASAAASSAVIAQRQRSPVHRSSLAASMLAGSTCLARCHMMLIIEA